MRKTYIDYKIIQAFKNKNGPFNYTKLISLLDGINKNSDDLYVAAPLVRAVIDHIPPLLECKTFEEVVNNYPWSQTDKGYMKTLLDFKLNGDDVLHRQISDKLDYLDSEPLPKANRINLLLQECLIKGDKLPLFTSKPTKISKIKVSLVSNSYATWTKHGLGNFIWSSFQVLIKIDNFDNTKPDYVSVALEAKDVDGEKWKAEHFMFDVQEPLRPNPDIPFKIEPGDIKEKVSVLLSDQKAEMGLNIQRSIPNIDTDTLKLIIATRSGYKEEVPISSQFITRG